MWAGVGEVDVEVGLDGSTRESRDGGLGNRYKSSLSETSSSDVVTVMGT